MAHLIKELLEINAGLLGVPVGVQRRMHVHVPLLVCGRREYSYSTVCVCVCNRVSLGVCTRVSSLAYFLLRASVCMHVSFSFLSASQPVLPLIGGARWLTQRHTLRSSRDNLGCIWTCLFMSITVHTLQA